ncbi:MAG: hypothetical protein AAF975_07065, partial [Spirochaetota bacterium]
MILIDYLHKYFFTLPEMVAMTKIPESSIRAYQDGLVMPLASYKLNVALNCSSFTGVHDETHHIEYYAKGYVSW